MDDDISHATREELDHLWEHIDDLETAVFPEKEAEEETE